MSACLLAVLAGAALVMGSRGGDQASAAETAMALEGSANLMQGTAYNAAQPFLHAITLPPGGTNTTTLQYAYPSNTELLLNSSSTKVECTSTGGHPGATIGTAACDIEILGFELWMEGFKIVAADRIHVRASSISSTSGTSSTYALQLQGLCIRTGHLGPCHNPGQGETITVDWPPLSGTITVGTPQLDVTNGQDLGSGVSVTAFHVNLFNADYTDMWGNASVIIDIANVKSFAAEMDPTPTPTRTPTPKKTPTKTPTATPEKYQAVVPVLSRDE